MGIVGNRARIVVRPSAEFIFGVVDLVGADARVVEQNGAIKLLDAGVIDPLIGGDVGDGVQGSREVEICFRGDVKKEPVGADGEVGCGLRGGSGRDEIDDSGATDLGRRGGYKDDLCGGKGARGVVEMAYGVEGFTQIEGGGLGRRSCRRRGSVGTELGGWR